MFKKRLLASIVVRENIVVQSFGFKNFLPLGNIKSSIKNLNRWQADEILILSIDSYKKNLGPNIKLLEDLKDLNINTPVIYGGGIRTIKDAKTVIKNGADRILVESVIQNNFNEFKKISKIIGAQSIIVSMPFAIQSDKILVYDYKSDKELNLSKNYEKAIDEKLFSELLLIDYKNQGHMKGFNKTILKKIKYDIPLVLSGGIYTKKNFEEVFKDKRVVAATVGNYLNYGEHKIQELKSILNKKFLRYPFYEK